MNLVPRYFQLPWILSLHQQTILNSIEDSIPACHAGDPGSIPGRWDQLFSNLIDLTEINSNARAYRGTYFIYDDFIYDD